MGVLSRRPFLLGIFALSLFFGAPEACAQSREYQLKAVYLFKFAQFVRWPARAFADAAAPLVIGVLGDDAFGGTLEELSRGESIGSHKLVIRHSARVEDLKGCQMIFASKWESARLAEVFALLEGASVLTVGESDQFERHGGVINFVMHGSTLGFRINNKAARRVGLEISSKLLKLGEP